MLDGIGFEPRLAWMLRHVDGHTLPEVAAALGVSLATAKRRLAEAEQVVREHVAPRAFLLEAPDRPRGLP